MYDRFLLKPDNEQERLAALFELDLLDGRHFPELDRLTSLAVDVCNADQSLITVFDADDATSVSASREGVWNARTPRADTFCTHVIHEPRTLVVNDAATDPRFSNNRFVVPPNNLRSYIGVPVGSQRGLPVGVLCVTQTYPNAFSQASVSHLQKVGMLVDAFLETRRNGLRAEEARKITAAGGMMLQERQEMGRGVVDLVPNDAPDATGREVLCVDDNHRNLYVIGAILRAAGHQTTECASGVEALALLAARKFDVVILDMVMPDMDGLETLTKLRDGGGPNADTPVIACTANVLPDQVEAYKKAGTASVLAKPIDARAMLEAVATAAWAAPGWASGRLGA